MKGQVFAPKFDVEGCLAQIRECLECGWTGMGFKTIEFESAWKKYTAHPHAFFLNSSTAGLNLAVQIFRMEYRWDADSEIITTPLTFVSTNHAILGAGLKPVFADIDETLCISPESLEAHITSRTRAVMYVGIGGNPGHFGEISEICRRHRLKLILDAAHMAGSLWKDVFPGTLADVAVYSFQAVKNLPTADSGMICFQDEHFDSIARKMAWLGINKDTFSRVGKNGNYKWEYDVEYVGNKYHGNSIIASIGLVQLKHLEEDNVYRRKIAGIYDHIFSKYPDAIKLQYIPEDCISSRHIYPVIVNDRNSLILSLNERGIFPGVHYTDNTKYRMYKYADNTCPHARYISEHICSIPLHLYITEKDAEEIASYVIENTCDKMDK